MAKNIKTRKGNDGFHYPYTSPDLVIDENGKSATTKFNEINTQLDSIETEVNKPITLNKCDEEMLGAIQNKEGETTFNLLSIPRDGSVTPEKTNFVKSSYQYLNPVDVTTKKSFLVRHVKIYILLLIENVTCTYLCGVGCIYIYKHTK